MKRKETQINYLITLANDDDLLEVARLAIEDQLVWMRNDRLSVLRNNGLVIKERDGRESHVIRMGPEMAMRTGLLAIAKHLKSK